jgi:hypothetical protein
MDTHDELIACLEDNFVAGSWTAGVIFDEDIINEPRFGWVPLFHEATLGSGTTNLTIKDFRPVYIQTTLWGCNATSCDLYWDPAEGVTPGPNNVRIEASTAINLPKAMLPTKVTDTEPGTDNAVVYLLSK